MSVVRGQMVLRGLRFRVNGCRTQKVVQNLGLHSFNFQAVTASSSLEFPRAGGLAHLGKPALEAHDTFLCCFEFLVVSYHTILPFIHIVRFRLGGDIAAKNDQALQVAGSASQFLHVHQTACASVPTDRLSAKASDDFVQSGSVDVRGQIAEDIELWQGHVRLYPQRFSPCGKSTRCLGNAEKLKC